jgi:hypothetical protein
VCEVAAGIKAHTQNGVAGLGQRQHDSLVGLAAGIGLHVGKAAIEQLAGAFNRKFLSNINEVAAAVIATTRIALGVFVGHHRALRFHHGARNDVFRGDQLNLMLLATKLAFDGSCQFRIGCCQIVGEKGRVQRIGVVVGHSHGRRPPAG